ncbi:hypothetical protein C8F01DRAFT_723715 [Mycena amicta]|nr:hypothetical protein C8F01DRAFT_723715 [Mycena amicta]
MDGEIADSRSHWVAGESVPLFRCPSRRAFRQTLSMLPLADRRLKPQSLKMRPGWKVRLPPSRFLLTYHYAVVISRSAHTAGGPITSRGLRLCTHTHFTPFRRSPSFPPHSTRSRQPTRQLSLIPVVTFESFTASTSHKMRRMYATSPGSAAIPVPLFPYRRYSARRQPEGQDGR